MNKLDNKTAVVTGGRQGIGRAITQALASQGARVLTCGRGERPTDLPTQILWQQADVSRPEDVNRLLAQATRDFESVDILVNNAGVQLEKTVLQSDDADWELISGTNMKGVFQMCRAFIPIMKERGSIINIGSISASNADPGMALYNASKAFVQGLTRSIAVDHGPKIRCNAISPGWIMTDMVDAAFAQADSAERAQQDALQRHPVGRFGQPEDIANMAVWLASDESGFASGQCFTIDGGLTAASPLNPALF